MRDIGYISVYNPCKFLKTQFSIHINNLKKSVYNPHLHFKTSKYNIYDKIQYTIQYCPNININ
jgi:hypothetical protein